MSMEQGEVFLDAEFIKEAGTAADHAYSFTPYEEMPDNAWPNVVKALYPIIAKHVMSHIIAESYIPGEEGSA